MSENGVLARHQVVLVRAVARALVVGVVLVERDQGCAGQLRGQLARLRHDQFAGLVPPDRIEGGDDLRRGVLRVRVVDVEPSPVGEDDVGQADLLVGELARVCKIAAEVEAAGVAQRVLLVEVPPGPPTLARRRGARTR